MTTTALTKLLDLLTSTLSTSDMVWLVKEMKNYLQGNEENLKPYTVEELLERAEEGRRQIAMGNYTTIEDLFIELDRDFEEDNAIISKDEFQLEAV